MQYNIFEINGYFKEPLIHEIEKVDSFSINILIIIFDDF